jgi:hypothetical protein
VNFRDLRWSRAEQAVARAAFDAALAREMASIRVERSRRALAEKLDLIRRMVGPGGLPGPDRL